MEKIEFKDKKITVMGIGLHGGAVAMIKWLLSQGARVTATDMKSSEELKVSLEKLKGLKNLTVITGQHRMEDFERAQMVIKNPVVRWDNKYVKAALDKKIPVEMDSSLFLKLCPSKKTIGITGTKGKTTTSTLVYEMLRNAGRKTVAVGIGQEAVISKLSEIDKDTWVVFELSSWRLSALKQAGLSPHIAVVTNIYQDHLNYYGNMKEYVADKQAIFANQKEEDFVVLNWDNEKASDTPAGGKISKSQRMYIALQPIDENKSAFIKEGKIQYNFDGRLGEIAKVEDIRLRGGHNLANVLAAVSIGIIIGLKPEIIKKTIQEYKGAPHRLEFVRKLEGVKFYNDTAATTPESGIAGINAFTEPLSLICGGSNKNLDLTKFAQKLAQTENVHQIFLLKGAATDGLEKLIRQFEGGDKIAGVYESMDAAVQAAYEKSQAGKEIVLLSPGCASFGMFQNEFDRGDKFKKTVTSL